MNIFTFPVCAAAGPRSSTPVPAGFTSIEASGKFTCYTLAFGVNI
jgi:hypothetical protein